MPAFVLATFGWWSVLTFVLDHALAFSGSGLVVIGVACIALEIFVPGSIPLIRAALGAVTKLLQWLVGTTAGAFVLVGLLCLALGFGAGRFIGRSADLERQLQAERAQTAAAEAAAAKAHADAVKLDAVYAAATKRADAAEDQAADDADQVSAYTARLAATDAAATTEKAPKAPRPSFALTDADVAALLAIGARRPAKTH